MSASSNFGAGRFLRSITAIAVLTIFSVSVSAQGLEPIQQPRKVASDVYIVLLSGDPVVAYEGEYHGMTATKPAKGKKINPHSKAVEKYVGYLDSSHDEVLGTVGAAGQKVYDYRYSFNGFAARLTHSQMLALESRSDVVQIWKDELMQPTTNTSPDFIGLTGGDGPWSEGFVGEDVIIGMIDTGIQPDHPSLADVPTHKKGNKGKLIPFGPPPAGWSGTGCEFGSGGNDTPFVCNNKLLKAEAFGDAFRGFTPFVLGEFDSARDSDGHGTHTTTTAGGNNGVPAAIDGTPLGTVSGMAPRARIATYKVCWAGEDGSGCFSSDSMAAIDQAVADGVDVINFSIGGSSTNFNGADDVAFLFAANAGVWVATSQGNSGPGAQTTGTPAGVPWVTAVGAAQDDQIFGTGLLVSSPASIAGTFDALEGAGPVRLADTGDITNSMVPSAPANGCAPFTNGGNISGNTALVIRGACGFITKYNNAAAAGAKAIVVYNDGTTPARVDPIVMGGLGGATIPGVMIGFFGGDLINSTVAGGATVIGTIGPSIVTSRENRIAGFSSRGPNGGAPDIIKPDVAAPGVNILAGETLFPNSEAGGGQFFQIISGTSMSSPHVAGVFALLKQAHPDWSPAMARSALMTTARQDLRKTFGATAADPFDIGAGHIVPEDSFKPGLVYDVDIFDYVRFTCGADTQPPIFTQGTCNFFGSIDSSNLNLPSIGVGELAGSQTVTRTVTAVADSDESDSDSDESDSDSDNDRDSDSDNDSDSDEGIGKRVVYRAKVQAPPGIDVSVSPRLLRLRVGENAQYEVTFTANDDAVFDEFAFGSLTWSNHEQKVRSPIAVRPIALAAPDGVRGAGTDGSLGFDVLFGYTGDYVVTMDGLAAGTPNPGAVADRGNDLHFFFVPPGTTLARFSLFDEDIGASNDLDLQVFGPDSAGFPFLGGSFTGTSEEEFNIVNPIPGFYAVFVIDFASAPGPTPYTLFNFNLDGSDAGNSVITPPAGAVVGTAGNVAVDWAALPAGTRALGIISHSDGIDTLGQTEVLINTQ